MGQHVNYYEVTFLVSKEAAMIVAETVEWHQLRRRLADFGRDAFYEKLGVPEPEQKAKYRRMMRTVAENRRKGMAKGYHQKQQSTNFPPGYNPPPEMRNIGWWLRRIAELSNTVVPEEALRILNEEAGAGPIPKVVLAQGPDKLARWLETNCKAAYAAKNPPPPAEIAGSVSDVS